MKQRTFSQEQIQQIIFLYNQKFSARQIAKNFNTTKHYILSILRNNYIRIRSKSEQLTGKIVSAETRKNMSIGQTGLKRAKSAIKKFRNYLLKSHASGERDNVGQKISITAKKNWRDSDIRKRTLSAIRSETNRNKLKIITKNHWNNKDYRKKVLSSLLKSGLNRPNKSEKLVHSLLEEIVPNQYEYVGDGKIIIEGFNPDFIDKLNKKIIEFFGNYWHSREDYKIRDKKKLQIYKDKGYKVLVIWGSELENIQTLKNRIQKFENSGVDEVNNNNQTEEVKNEEVN